MHFNATWEMLSNVEILEILRSLSVAGLGAILWRLFSFVESAVGRTRQSKSTTRLR